ncbi:MAG: glucose-6-phosphate dehydrogenase assembly protein OpcA [Bryobacterales bacterium]|nr:glucose-6-phosphate dehydrogenase assembly protein OpcA [Bryobacteraceae bacterium]MDW8354051.1 glucose-6-phosphate dehydrogenase assembly protein OpcA [Bryobacterales bacterium]
MAARPERLMAELETLWEQLARRGEEGVLRACALTLVAVTDAGEDVGRAGATLAELTERHPARAILLRLSEGGAEPEARVFAHCWLPRASRRQICSEQIEITAGRERLREIIPVLLALAAPDLPVAMWWRNPEVLLAPEQEELAALASHVISDAGGTREAARFLARMAAWLRPDRTVGDLAWARLTRWREALAQAFECAAGPTRSWEISAAVVVSPGGSKTVAACYMAAWLAMSLGWAPDDRRLRIEHSRTPGPGSLEAVRLSGSSFSVSLERRGPELVEVRLNGEFHHRFFPRQGEAELLAEELTAGPRDEIYRRCLVAAAALARRLEQR